MGARLDDWKQPSFLISLGVILASFLAIASPSLAGAKGFRLDQRNDYTGKPYDDLRPMLELAGWAPENVHGPYQDYPEIHCSSDGRCVGYWKKKGFRELYVDVNILQEMFLTEAIQTDTEYKREHAN